MYGYQPNYSDSSWAQESTPRAPIDDAPQQENKSEWLRYKDPIGLCYMCSKPTDHALVYSGRPAWKNLREIKTFRIPACPSCVQRLGLYKPAP